MESTQSMRLDSVAGWSPWGGSGQDVGEDPGMGLTHVG